MLTTHHPHIVVNTKWFSEKKYEDTTPIPSLSTNVLIDFQKKKQGHHPYLLFLGFGNRIKMINSSFLDAFSSLFVQQKVNKETRKKYLYTLAKQGFCFSGSQMINFKKTKNRQIIKYNSIKANQNKKTKLLYPYCIMQLK